MLFAAALATTFALAEPQLLRLEVAPVTLRQGDPLRIPVTLCLIGIRPVQVTSTSCDWPCNYTLPANWDRAWHDGEFFTSCRPANVTMEPGKPLKLVCDISELCEVRPPAGRHTLRLRGQLVVTFGNRDAGRIWATLVDVPVTIVGPR